LISIHPTAVIAKEAQIGEDVSIGAFSVVEKDVVIEDGVQIGPNVFVDNGARIGKNCKIHKGAVVSTPPQDLKYAGEETLFIIGENTTIREFCTLNRGTIASGKTEIGSNCLLMAYAHVAHDCLIGDHVILANGVQLGGHVTIEEWAIIGGMTPIHQFCKVGQHCMVGGGYRAVQDVPPYITASGEPLKFAGINSIGLRRRGFDSSTVMTIKRVYKLIYRSGLNRSHALQRIREEFEMTPEIEHIINFIESSDRGIIK